MTIFETNILYYCNLDICGCSETFNFWHDCWIQISGGNKPKIGISNMMPQLCYKHYPSMLEGLIFADKAAIAQAHSVITILKLRPNNCFKLRSYKDVREHSMLLPQNPGLLLNLLPSEIINKVVRVVWESKSLPRPKQLSAFMSI